uniref:Amidase domain-containing protein n=1 Tax=Clastoptera arizonana TaxID=38151 RepID=A0A1B6C6F5_9HEMI
MNARLNAVVEERIDDSYLDAIDVDILVESGKKTPEEIERDTPLFGVPLSVKECCMLKGMSYAVGCLNREEKRATDDGDVVRLLRKAGAIPMVVSNQPELCMSQETNNLITGLTRNPYDQHRTVGGTSGGEAALVGSAASVIGIGSDIAGSLRCPAMFTGVFAHKPTAEVISLRGHYPVAKDTNFDKYLTIGPIVRYAEDLPLMLNIMSGSESKKLNLDKKVNVKSLKILYIEELENSFGLIPVENDIKDAIKKAINHFNAIGCDIKKADFEELSESPEISTSVLFNLKGLPDVFNEIDDPKNKPNLFIEILKSVFGLSMFSLSALTFNVMKNTNCFIPKSKTEHYSKLNESLRSKLLNHLGDNGVFILPTFPTSAHYHNMHLVRNFGTVYVNMITALRLPCTQVPMGLNRKGLPIGFQVS